MPESSVDSYINAQPEAVMSESEWNNAHGLGTLTSDNWIAKIGDFFTGAYSKSKSDYQAYLKNIENMNEFKATQSARAWEEYMDSTRIQRAMKDYEKAGINPYLAINQGAISTGSAGSGAKASYSYRDKASDNGAKGRNFALMLLALAKVASTLL